MEILYWSVSIGSATGWIVWRHPLFSLPLLVAASLLAGEFYPLSDFPMYSDPDERENYFYLAAPLPDGTHEPLAVRLLTGISAPKVKKMYKTRLRALLDDPRRAAGPRRMAATRTERERVARDLLAHLRELAALREAALPSRIALVEVWIEYDDDAAYTETNEVVATSEARAG